MLNFEIEARRAAAVTLTRGAGALPVGTSLEWLKLQAHFGVPVWAVCLNCEYTRLLGADDLLAMIKPDVAELASLTDRMKCRCCGGKACEMRAATPVPEYCS